MSFPALNQLGDEINSLTGKEIRRGFPRWRVLMFLRPPRLNFAAAREVKVAEIRHVLHLSPNAVTEALDWLTEQGYLIEAGRTSRGVRRLMLVYEREPRQVA